MIKIYRTLVIVSLMSFGLYMGLPYFDAAFLNEDEIKVLAWGGYGSIITYPQWLGWVLTFVWIPIAIGMVFFYPIARKVYVLLTVVFIVMNPLSGLMVLTGLQAMVYEITTLLDGAILTMAYFTSINEEFKKNA